MYDYVIEVVFLRSCVEVNKDFVLFQVATVKVKAVHVGSASETVEIRGVPVDMQTCYVADHTDSIKLDLWERW